VVDVAALTCYLLGIKTSVSSVSDESITRAATDVASVSSITVTSVGAIAVVQGTDSVDSTYNDVRDSAGGPPLIPVGSIEVGQVRTTTNTAGALTADEIFQVIGIHQERYDSPLWDVDSENAAVNMFIALPLIHVGNLPKSVNASYYDPIFADVNLASDFVPSENTHSINSTPIYGATLGSTSKSLSQGTFTAYLKDGVTDPLVKSKDDTLWFKFRPDRYLAPYILTQGTLGMTRAFPAGDSLSAACTISSEKAAVDVEG
jgi:hypothetical protein